MKKLLTIVILLLLMWLMEWGYLYHRYQQKLEVVRLRQVVNEYHLQLLEQQTSLLTKTVTVVKQGNKASYAQPPLLLTSN